MRLFGTRSRIALLLSAAALAAGGAAGAAAGTAAGQDSSAVAVNTKDNSSVFRLTFAIRQVMGDTVDNQNAAVAYASCTACQTVAISIQVLLIASDPTTFDPTNIAIAYNQDCTLCDTLATAYQFAVGVGTRLKFTAAGRQDIADIRSQLEQLRNADQTGAAIQDSVDALMQRLSGVLASDLVGASQPAGNGGGTTTSPTDTTPTTTGTAPASTTPTTSAPAETTTTPTETTTTPTTTDTTPTNTSTTPTSTTTTPASTDTTPATTQTTPGP